MTGERERIKKFLLTNRGYLKVGAKTVSLRVFGSDSLYTINLVKEVQREIRNETKVKLDKQVEVKSGISDKDLLETRKFYQPKLFNITHKIESGGNVLIISDTHLPFEREGSLDFCNDIKNKYNCKTIIHIGDEIDNCAISQYAKDPDGLSAGSEAAQAQSKILDWYKAFPDVNVCIGNHTNRMFRLAHLSGIPRVMLKSYEELWQAPKGWKWSEYFDVQGVHYSHGSGMSGPNAAMKKAVNLRKSCVIGHIHTEATIQYNVSALDRIFGMQVGCLVDDKAYAFAYAKDNTKKSILSCGVVTENGTLPIIELMKI